MHKAMQAVHLGKLHHRHHIAQGKAVEHSLCIIP